MGDSSHDAGAASHSPLLPSIEKDNRSDPQEPQEHSNAAFQSQLDPLAHAQHRHAGSYNPQQFNLGSLAQSLPQVPHSPMNTHGPYGPQQAPHLQHNFRSALPQQYAGHGFARAPQMQHAPFPSMVYNPYPPMRQPIHQASLHTQYNPADLYGISSSPTSHQMTGPMFGPAGPFSVVPGMSGDFLQSMRRESAPASIPSIPRGPPRKPKQSGHALWVGNLPPAAQIGDLKDHFSRDAAADIESVFLISKSNCAFVNYRSEKACSDAMARFHDSRFQGVRLVCRLRRSTTSNTPAGIPTTTAVEEESESGSRDESPAKDDPEGLLREPEIPLVVRSSSQPSPSFTSPDAAVSSVRAGQRVPERYFIVKSLTVQDLESSIRTGIWATQEHNESLLNDAYENADSVYLIFSANKSGEYFGYARMASPIADQAVDSTPADNEPPSAGNPHAIETPPTPTAPKGRIIDDSARGIIFWEAVRSEQDDAEIQGGKPDGGSDSARGLLGRQFSIEWITTVRLPFYRTRGLRNPWNSNREVKIARDGTELEPSIGRKLAQMFHRPPLDQSGQQLAMQRR